MTVVYAGIWLAIIGFLWLLFAGMVAGAIGTLRMLRDKAMPLRTHTDNRGRRRDGYLRWVATLTAWLTAPMWAILFLVYCYDVVHAVLVAVSGAA